MPAWVGIGGHACMRLRRPLLPPVPPPQGKDLSLQLAHMHLEQRETRRMERCVYTPRTRPAHAPHTAARVGASLLSVSPRPQLGAALHLYRVYTGKPTVS